MINDEMEKRQQVSGVYTGGELIDYTRNQLASQRNVIDMRIRGIDTIENIDMSIDSLLDGISDDEKLKFTDSLIDIFNELVELIPKDCDPIKISCAVINVLVANLDQGYDIAATYAAILTRIFSSVGCVRIE